MVIYVALLVAVVGLLVYVLASNPKSAEMGRLAFACGLLAFLIRVSADVVPILAR